MACIYDLGVGLESGGETAFDGVLGEFMGAKNIEMRPIGEGDLLEIRYELNGKKIIRFSRNHILLASLEYVKNVFFKEVIGNITNSEGEVVEVRRFPEGYSGDPLLNDLKKRIISAGVES